MSIHNSMRSNNDSQAKRRFRAGFLFAAITAVVSVMALNMWNPPKAEARDSSPQTFYGPAKAVGAGGARSYITMSDGLPVEIGFELEEDTLRALPAPDPQQHHKMDAPHRETAEYLLEHVDMTEYLLDLPEQAQATPFKFIELDWNPAGHDPSGIYDKPHFDFHFYTITQAERDAIDPSDPDFARKGKRLPKAELVPASYITPSPVALVPRMGLHWVSIQSEELHGKPFTQTFIHGSWNGRMIFFEPMITKAFLESKPDVTLPISSAKCYEPAGYYPTTYSIRYEESKRRYRVSLGGFEHRGCEATGTKVAEDEEPSASRKQP